jgi:HAMP domain-containing protein
VEPARRTIEELTLMTAELADRIEAGTIEVTEPEKTELGLVLRSFEAQVDRLRTHLEIPEDEDD